jgi:hypothetical protein
MIAEVAVKKYHLLDGILIPEYYAIRGMGE